MARLHTRVRQLRKEYHHKVAKSLVDRYAAVCAESLNVRGMVRNGKLARAILDSYGELEDVNSKAGRTMGKNDVRIAATAKVTGTTLLTADGDFDHLHPAHLTRIRVDEKTGNPLP